MTAFVENLPVARARTGSVAPHFVALDVDGTLMGDDGRLSPAVREAVTAAVAAGHMVSVASGRSLASVLPVLKELGLHRGYAVCSNGGSTIRLDPELPQGYEVIDRVTFTLGPVLAALSEAIPGVCFAVETASGAYLSTTPFRDPSFGGPAERVEALDLQDIAAIRLVASSAETDATQFLAAVDGAALSGVSYSIGWGGWLDLAGTTIVDARAQGLLRAQVDVAARNVSKASGLEKLRVKLGVDHCQTVAVGDGSNDLEMLRWASRGVAMGQAEEEVRAAADEVTGTVEQDGAAMVLRSLG